MKTRLVILATVSMIFSAFSGDVWLFVKPLNYYYNEAKLFVMTDLLKQEVQVQGSVEVKMVERPENGPDLENDAAARKEALSLTKTNVGFSGKISQMENTVFIYTFKWNSSGEIVYQERISVPLGEDAEALITRLAKCIVNNEKFNKTATAGTITMKDGKQSLRKSGSVMFIGRTGILYPWNESFRVMEESGSGYSYKEGNTFSMEFGIGYDVDYMILEAMMGFDGTRDLCFTIGGEYLFLQGDFVPYVGGEVGVAIVNKAESDMYNYNGTGIDEESLEKDSDGFYGGLRVGVLLFRNHTIKFMPEIRAINVFNKDWDKGLRATIGVMLAF
jgi:hypothetical protein